MNRVNQDQIQEWVANPVTEILWWLCSRELANVQEVSPADMLFGGDPQKTQENLLASVIKEQEWNTFLALLKGKFKEELGDLKTYSSLVEEVDEE